MSAGDDLDETDLPDPLVDPAKRLFSFLGQAQQLKSPSVSDLETYRRDGAVHWLDDVPVHPGVQPLQAEPGRSPRIRCSPSTA